MKVYAIATALVGTLGIWGAHAAAVATENRSQLGVMTWIGPATRGGQNITLTGTTEEIYAEITARNPNFERDLGDENARYAQRLSARGVTVAPVNLASLKCDEKSAWKFFGKNPAPRTKGIKEGINTLRNMGGMCVLKGKEGKCTELTCSWEAGILACNHRDFDNLHVPCSHIADNAEVIMNRCSWDNTWGLQEASGKIWSFGRTWQVELKSSWC